MPDALPQGIGRGGHRPEVLLGALAVAEGYLTKPQLDECLRAQAESPGERRLGEVLVERGHLTAQALEALLEVQRYEVAEIVDNPDAGGLFGQVAAALGFVSTEDVHRAAREQGLRTERGDFVRLGQLLVEEGRLTMAQVLEVLRRQDRGIARCADCRKLYLMPGGPAGRRFLCPGCFEVLTPGPVGEEPAVGEPDLSPRSPLEVGSPASRIGRFQLRSVLGYGGMAVVFRARDPELDRDVALKVMRRTVLTGPDEARRFQREARLAARLAHPNIAAVHETGEADGHLYIAMELIDGTTLHSLLGQGAAPRAWRLEVVERVSRAVHAAHEAGIIHRDLKPANILLTREGDPKIADFGIAKIAGGGTRFTQPGTTAGTPEYMAPEQARGEVDKIDARTDVYALGVILYEALTGDVPFHSTTLGDVLAQIAGSELAFPRRPREPIPLPLRIVASKAMEKERARRYATALEFAEDLRRARLGEPILARPPSRVERTARFLRRRRAAVAAVAAILAAVAALTFGALWVRDGLERAARTRAEVHLRRGRELVAEAWRVPLIEGAPQEAFEDRLEEAHEEFERAVEIAPRWAVPHLELAEVCLALGQMAFAQEHVEGAIQIDPDFAEAYVLRARLGSFQYAAGVGLPEVRYAAGRATFVPRPPPPWAPGLREQIEQDLRRAQELGATGPEVVLVRAALQLIDGDFEAAAGAAREILAHSPLDASAWFVRTEALLALGRAEEAVEAASRLVPLRRNWPFVWALQAQALLASGRAEEAERTATRVIDLDDRSAAHFELRGIIRHGHGDGEGAMADYDRALALDPALATAWMNRGVAHLAAGRPDAALADFTEAIARAPAGALAHANRSKARLDLGDYAAAAEDATAALALDADCVVAYQNRGVARSFLEEHEGAVADFTEAIRRTPDTAILYAARGLEFESLDRPLDALRDLEEAVRRDSALGEQLAPSIERLRERVGEF